MGAYTEEIWDRAELKFGTITKAKSWLSGFNKGTQNAYTNDGIQIYSELIDSDRLKDRISRSRTPGELNDLITQIDNLEINQLKGPLIKKVENIESWREKARNLTWDDIKTSVFAKSIKEGKVTNRFKEFYLLDNLEAENIVNNLQSQAISESEI